MEVRLKEKIPGVFWPVHQAIRRGEVTEVVAKGGRGSGKSSYLSMELVWQLLRHPDCHAVVLRKVGGTLRNSVYNQIVWAIGELGCAGYFRCTVSPMECTYLPTGQKILFFGTDDPGKLKSLKLPFGAVGICWFEELDQFDGPEEVRNVEQTVLRGGSWTLTLKSFNPPAMARSWANRYALETRPGKLVHHSTYRDLPRAMLGERFWADAEHLQRTNPAAFRHEYGGEVVGSGAAVFANLQLRAVPDDELHRHYRCFDELPIAFTDIEMVLDDSKNAVDWIFRYANPALAKLEKVPLNELIGHSFRSVFPNMDSKWLKSYERSALYGETLELIDHSPEIDTYLKIICFPTQPGHCGCLLFDIAEMQFADDSGDSHNAKLRYFAKMLEKLV